MIRSCSRYPLWPWALAPARKASSRRFPPRSTRRTISPSANGSADTCQPYQARPAHASALLDEERVRRAYLGICPHSTRRGVGGQGPLALLLERRDRGRDQDSRGHLLEGRRPLEQECLPG